MNVVEIIKQVESVVVVEDTGTVIEIIQQTPQVISVAQQGPRGPSGTGDKSFEQDFISQSSITVTHNLGKFPSVTVLDSAGDECEGLIEHLSINQLTATFSAPFSGSIICN